MKQTAATKWAAFDYWYNWHGHWMYDAKCEAEEVWAKRGISTLPSYPGPRAK